MTTIWVCALVHSQRKKKPLCKACKDDLFHFGLVEFFFYFKWNSPSPKWFMCRNNIQYKHSMNVRCNDALVYVLICFQWQQHIDYWLIYKLTRAFIFIFHLKMIANERSNERMLDRTNERTNERTCLLTRSHGRHTINLENKNLNVSNAMVLAETE